MEISSLGEHMQRDPDVTDHTNKGACSNCGECCSSLLPVSDDEIKQIRQYIKSHHIKPKSGVRAPMTNHMIDLTCPFLDVGREQKCMIYEVRPLICRKFTCGKDKPLWRVDELTGRKLKNMREVFE